jgi:hypothetical protein
MTGLWIWVASGVRRLGEFRCVAKRRPQNLKYVARILALRFGSSMECRSARVSETQIAQQCMYELGKALQDGVDDKRRGDNWRCSLENDAKVLVHCRLPIGLRGSRYLRLCQNKRLSANDRNTGHPGGPSRHVTRSHSQLPWWPCCTKESPQAACAGMDRERPCGPRAVQSTPKCEQVDDDLPHSITRIDSRVCPVVLSYGPIRVSREVNCNTIGAAQGGRGWQVVILRPSSFIVQSGRDSVALGDQMRINVVRLTPKTEPLCDIRPLEDAPSGPRDRNFECRATVYGSAGQEGAEKKFEHFGMEESFAVASKLAEYLEVIGQSGPDATSVGQRRTDCHRRPDGAQQPKSHLTCVRHETSMALTKRAPVAQEQRGPMDLDQIEAPS